MPTTQALGLLVLPGWDDDGRQQFDALKSVLDAQGWICHRANLPDCSWPAKEREAFSREDALKQALADYSNLDRSVAGGPIAVLGFSFGAYIGACVTATRPVQCLVLRSPALYPDQDWNLPKDDLDKRDMAEYRQQTHEASSNAALKACSGFGGDVLLIDSQQDRIIPLPVISSYERAFDHANSVTRYTIKEADHQLTTSAWQIEYHDVALRWLNDHMPQKR